MSISIGVLDIQGSVEEHLAMLEKIGAKPVAVKKPSDLESVDGLIIPGGESTTIGKLMKRGGLDRAIQKRVRAKTLAVWGTCAGAILLAKTVRRGRPDTLGLMDIGVERNAFGRQLDSFETMLDIPALKKSPVPAVFIRAPRIYIVSPESLVLARYGGEPALVVQENMIATTFHPELTGDTTIHRYFLNITQRYAQSQQRH